MTLPSAALTLPLHLRTHRTHVSSSPSCCCSLQLVTYKPSTPLAVHGRIFALLVSIVLIDALWFAASVSIFGPAGTSVVLLMTFEVRPTHTNHSKEL